LLSTWSAGAASARISKEEVERWMGWTLAPLEFRDIEPSASAGASAPSLNGVVGSSLYISTAVDNFICSSRGEKLNFTVRCVQKLQLRASVAALLRYIYAAALSAATAAHKAAPKKLSSSAKPVTINCKVELLLSSAITDASIGRVDACIDRFAAVSGRPRCRQAVCSRDAAAAYCKLQRWAQHHCNRYQSNT
jgi:hypothetical protein